METPADIDPPAREVLRAPGVRAVLSLFVLSSTASALQSTVMLAHIYAITGNPLDLGLAGLAEFVPSVLFVLVTGAVADRFDRLVIVRITLLGQLACFVALLLYARTDPTAVGPMFVITVLYGTFRAFSAPAKRSLPAMIAPPHGLARVVALSSLTWQIAAIAGPILGGILFDVGPVPAYAVACGIVVAALAVTAATRVSRQERTAAETVRPTLRSAIEGLVVIRRSPVLFGAISLDLFAVLFGGAVALIPAIATERLGVDATGQGVLRAAAGAGAAICGVVLAARPVTRRIGKVLFVCVGVFGAATVVLGATRTFWVAVLAMGVLSAADMVSMYIRSTIIPLASTDATRGRVFAVEQVFIGASNELGAFQSGVAAAVLGTALAVSLGGVATLVVAALWWKLFPVLRDVDRFSEVVPAVPHTDPRAGLSPPG